MAAADEQISPFGIEYPEANMSKFVALVVEDDPLQRTFVADLLKDEGLQVVECASAEAAELVLVSTGNELRALVTDVNLAGDRSGVELAQFAKRKFPDLNVVMVSGRGSPRIPDNTRFLMKPYLPDELLKAVLN
jgi:DNA-binding NtrC family response regulator